MSAQQITEAEVFSALRRCMDPEIPINIVDLGLVYGVQIRNNKNVDITMTMTTRGCPLHNTLISDVKRHVGNISGVGDIDVQIVWDPPWSIEKMNPVAREKIGLGKPKLRFQVDYEKYQPEKIGRLVKQEDGSLALLNENEQGFMVNQAIVDFWQTCDGKKTIDEMTDQFAAKLSLPREQVEQEVVQLVQQLLEGGLLKPS